VATPDYQSPTWVQAYSGQLAPPRAVLLNPHQPRSSFMTQGRGPSAGSKDSRAGVSAPPVHSSDGFMTSRCGRRTSPGATATGRPTTRRASASARGLRLGPHWFTEAAALSVPCAKIQHSDRPQLHHRSTGFRAPHRRAAGLDKYANYVRARRYVHYAQVVDNATGGALLGEEQHRLTIVLPESTS